MHGGERRRRRPTPMSAQRMMATTPRFLPDVGTTDTPRGDSRFGAWPGSPESKRTPRSSGLIRNSYAVLQASTPKAAGSEFVLLRQDAGKGLGAPTSPQSSKGLERRARAVPALDDDAKFVEKSSRFQGSSPSAQEAQSSSNFQSGGSGPSKSPLNRSSSKQTIDDGSLPQADKTGKARRKLDRQDSSDLKEPSDEMVRKPRQTRRSLSDMPYQEDGASSAPSRKISASDEDYKELAVQASSRRESSKETLDPANVHNHAAASLLQVPAGNEKARYLPRQDSKNNLKDEEDDIEDEGEAFVDPSWIKSFDKFKDHNEVHVEDLHRCLEHCGFVSPKHEWIQEIFKVISPRYNTIEKEDFITFVLQYQKKQHHAYALAFASCDSDGSGFVEREELADLLREFDIEPMSHVLKEVIEEVDEDGRGTLDLDEFKQLMDVILLREGFTKSEYEEFIGIFERFDRDGSGEIDVKELAALLNWLGFASDTTKLKAVVSEVDVDGSGEINQREYLMCMRKLRETELKRVVELIAQCDEDGGGTISKGEAIGILKGLGYEPYDLKVIQEAGAAAGLVDGVDMDLSEFWRLLLVFRKKEGFSEAENLKLEQAFDAQDRDRSGDLTSLEAARALRELGFTASFEVMQSVLAKVDVDDTGELDKVEFRKMVRMLQEREVHQYKEAFLGAVEKDSKLLGEKKASELIQGFGFRVSKKYLSLVANMAPDSRKEDNKIMLDIDGFVHTCCRHAHDVREVYRKNGGWSDREVMEMKAVFSGYDIKQSGMIANKELVKLVEDLFPTLARDRAMRPQLQSMLKQTCNDPSGGLGFTEFLKLMQLFREFQDREHVQKELNAIKGTGFSGAEVAEFRDFFLNGDYSSGGELSFEELRAMIHQITPLGDALTAELHKIYHDITIKRGAGSNGAQNQELDFPDFLWMMKHLLDINFANIKEKTQLSCA
eukprot:TRINITY_DN36202_c0_g1_i1.p1 TRINITY_DN36202_c0_g1~~TRINITY_DN36202_c0_g1_i1.p1  ORF type:complete len:993 (-),score=227.74 TRINITY_DN36202_c0_g1_i1:28-2868(-)